MHGVEGKTLLVAIGLPYSWCGVFSSIVGEKQRVKHDIGTRGDSGKVSNE